MPLRRKRGTESIRRICFVCSVGSWWARLWEIVCMRGAGGFGVGVRAWGLLGRGWWFVLSRGRGRRGGLGGEVGGG